MNFFYSIGLMSGTSMDGIDAVLMKTDGEYHIEVLACASLHYEKPFRFALKFAEFLLHQCEGNEIAASERFSETWAQYKNAPGLAEIDIAGYFHAANLNFDYDAIQRHSTDLHIKLAQQLKAHVPENTAAPLLIGYHGQTLYHAPQRKLTLQMGLAQYFAEVMQTPVISQFRQNDIAHGGQGAPLAPLYHHAKAIRDQLLPLSIVNIGGIANLTWLPNEDICHALGFDVGPGNVLLDKFIRERSHHEYFYDEDGRFAKSGQLKQTLFSELCASGVPLGFINELPPKSLDSYQCQLPLTIERYSTEDAAYTLAYFTAFCIAESFQFLSSAPKNLLLKGGGAKHPVIYQSLQNLLPGTQIVDAKQIQWSTDYLEAEIFAWLAVRSVLKLPISYPNLTGTDEIVSGGVCFEP